MNSVKVYVFLYLKIMYTCLFIKGQSARSQKLLMLGMTTVVMDTVLFIYFIMNEI